MLRISRSFILAAAAVLVLINLSYAGESDRRLRKDLPPAVDKYFGMFYPFAKVTGIARSTENGNDLYEIHSKDYGQRRTVLFNSDGAILNISETIPRCDLPPSLRHDIRQVYPHSRIRSVTKIYHWSDITFNVVVRSPGKEYHQISLTCDGRVIGQRI